MEIMNKKVINRSDFDGNTRLFQEATTLSNGLKSDLDTRAVHSLLVVLRSCIVASCLEPSVYTREREFEESWLCSN